MKLENNINTTFLKPKYLYSELLCVNKYFKFNQISLLSGPKTVEHSN